MPLTLILNSNFSPTLVLTPTQTLNPSPDPAHQIDALRDFVDKDERGAIADCVTRALKREQRAVLRRSDAPLDKEGDVAAALADRRRASSVSDHR